MALTWAYSLGVVIAIFWLLSRIGRLIEAFLISLSTRAATSWDDLLLPLAGKAVRRALPLLALILGAPAFSVSPALAEMVRNATSLLLIAVVAFILFQVVDAAASFVLNRHRIDVSDNLQARSIYTQVVVLKKVALTALGIFTLASMLMVFDSVRQFGASILASAGIAGIVVGFAAQRSIATLLAGFQIALTQPIRLDDVVIGEGEWGRIEDITHTLEIRALASVADASLAWDLRCEIREKGHLGGRRIPSPARHDEDGRVRVFACPVTFADMVESAFNEIAPVYRAICSRSPFPERGFANLSGDRRVGGASFFERAARLLGLSH